MTTQFKVTIQGTITREGFFPNESSPKLTITKFMDGSFQVKAGRKTIKHKHQACGKVWQFALKTIGINL